MWRKPEDRVAWRQNGHNWDRVRCGGSQRTVWPGERMDRAELE